MSKIFVSHSSRNNPEAVALSNWLEKQGWKDEIFLDVDPEQGIAPGARWERRLYEAADKCEAVVFLISAAWLASRWCQNELALARRLNKRMFGVLIEPLDLDAIPTELSAEWQLVQLASGRDHVILNVTLPITHEELHVTFSFEGLKRLKQGLELAGLAPKYFVWPPPGDPERSPFRGLLPLEAEDAGIFYGRDAQIVSALDLIRGLMDFSSPRLIVILAASGAGKSSFLRAGLIPRLARDDRRFKVLPILRPGRAAISGETGFVNMLQSAYVAANKPVARAEIKNAAEIGYQALQPMVRALIDKGSDDASSVNPTPNGPMLVIPIDQFEELFGTEGRNESRQFLALLRDLLHTDCPKFLAIVTIRSDAYEQLQLSSEFEGIRHSTLSLPPIPVGSYGEIITGPPKRLENSPRNLKIDPALVQALLVDIAAGGSKDSLPLLAFTLQRLYEDYNGIGEITLEDYEQSGRLRGSIEAAVDRAFQAADGDPAIPRDRAARISLLRRGFIPWLAGIDPDTNAPRRRVARLSEIPAESRPLIEHLVRQRLLSIDIAQKTGEATIEPAHESILRQWSTLSGWLSEDLAALSNLESVQRATRDWEANRRAVEWLAHTGDRLAAARKTASRQEFLLLLGSSENDYLDFCAQKDEREALIRDNALTTAPLRRVFYILAICAILIVDRNGIITFGLVLFIVAACLFDPARVVRYLGGAPQISGT